MPKIVILDDIEMTPEQQQQLKSLGDLKIFHGVPSSADEIKLRIGDADIVVLGWTQIGDTILSQLPNLKFIAVWATGYDYVDVEAAAKRRIPVANIPGYAAESVAELTIAIMLMLSRKILQADAHVRKGGYSWQGFQGSELLGQTLGIIGPGHIGGRVAQLANCFGMRVIATAKNPSAERARTLNLEFVKLDKLLKESDIVSIHVPLSSETKGLIGARELGLMKSSAFLINTTRAAVVDQKALYTALKTGQIAGAGLDDLALPDQAMLGLENVILTPHMAFYTQQAIVRKTDICIANIRGYLHSKPQNIVNRID